MTNSLSSEAYTMRVSKNALMRANKRADSAKRSLARMRSKMKGTPTLKQSVARL